MTLKYFPPPIALHTLFPLNENRKKFIQKSRRTVKKLLSGEDTRLALIVGPCSIHHLDSALDFAKRLSRLAHETSDNCFIVMRAFVEKARTRDGWKGLVNDPDLNGSHDIEAGVKKAREIFIQLTNLEVPIATEFLDPLIAPYLSDLVTWGIIGARTVNSQIHRILASSLPMPVGFKNSVDGNANIARHGAEVARLQHKYVGFDSKGKLLQKMSPGNPQTHMILRGSNTRINYDDNSIKSVLLDNKKASFNAPLLIDCAHGNCQGKVENQKKAFFSAFEQRMEGNKQIMGMMIESHLSKNLSITDPCLDWDTTEHLIRWANQTLRNIKASVTATIPSTLHQE